MPCLSSVGGSPEIVWGRGLNRTFVLTEPTAAGKAPYNHPRRLNQTRGTSTDRTIRPRAMG